MCTYIVAVIVAARGLALGQKSIVVPTGGRRARRAWPLGALARSVPGPRAVGGGDVDDDDDDDYGGGV